MKIMIAVDESAHSREAVQWIMCVFRTKLNADSGAR